MASKDKDVTYCHCATPSYSEGKCQNCGNWIDSPKKVKKRKSLEPRESHLENYCVCDFPEVHFSGRCQKCFNILQIPIDDSEEEHIVGRTVGDAVSEPLVKESSSVRNSEYQIAFCSSCGSKAFPDSAYCHSCGRKLIFNPTESNLGSASTVEPQEGKSISSFKYLAGLAVLLASLFLWQYFADRGTNFGTDDLGSRYSCDAVADALSFHDPRYFKMATQAETKEYKSYMKEAARLFGEEGESYLAQVAGQMSSGYKGIDENGYFPVLNYCGL